MEISPSFLHAQRLSSPGLMQFAQQAAAGSPQPEEVGQAKEKFQEFVAGTFFRTLLQTLRNTVQETKLMHGGKAEEIFRAHLDQTISEQLAASHGAGVADEMYKQFQLQMNRASTQAFEPEVPTLDERATSRTVIGAFGSNPG